MWEALKTNISDSTPQKPPYDGSSCDNSFALLRSFHCNPSSNYLPFIMCSVSVAEDKEVSSAVAV